ncbi:AlpA family phage regulatory protein [Porticoccaceae bacterium]|nr:AlpA family phage regulatory protein [Porticoccaceae bacterium]
MINLNGTPQILRWKQVADIVPWSRSYTYALMNQGLFPKPRKLMTGGQAVGWLSSDIDAYIRSLAENMERAGNE